MVMLLFFPRLVRTAPGGDPHRGLVARVRGPTARHGRPSQALPPPQVSLLIGDTSVYSNDERFLLATR
eukprot:6578695-Pyramimonas_sp.AAC.1